MTFPIDLTEREEHLANEIKKIYNSGQCKAAVVKSVEFLAEFPRSYLARYVYAVMHGDYSYTIGLSDDDKRKYREVGKRGVKELVEDPDFKNWPTIFQFRVRNEYCWFFELHREQYDLGLERIAFDGLGHYGASVGASMMALKSLREKNILHAETWAKKSYAHFKKFEEQSPNWYNINPFAAQALACLGEYEAALICYKDLYRKQNAVLNELEVADFLTKVAEIKRLRSL